MKLLKYSVLIFIICFVNVGLNAQEQQTKSINEGTIKDQFEFTIRKSSDWKDKNGQSYEVIKRHRILTLKKHTLDSLKAIQENLNIANNSINTQQKEINTLKIDLAKSQDILASTNKEKESIVFLGIQMSKDSYKTLMWSIIGILIIFLLIFIYKFKNSNVVTKTTKNRLTEIENEFKEHRRISMEREQKIKRQLQDEFNKYKG